ncbi:Proteasome inhibitor PI31 subunit [Pseudolycoriella hygida]|uniref:Proteasome inhibitor PI31 subunit n=1 Tax=Pseudolycoriella hygida TaxID=35572 RepID=A0A9Q0S7W7_9DIPT|nr:Proteasome inhibitor PI31 subunit [Pseudolycoriella hygida]
MEDSKMIKRWERVFHVMRNNIRTKNGLLFLVAHWCLMNIVAMECDGNVCTSESDDEIRYKAWDANDDPCAVKYRKENHVYRLLGEVTNAGHLLNFKNRKIKALSNNITLNVDDMTDVIDGRITLRKPVQEVTKLLLDELFTPVLHLSRAVSYLHTNSNGQFFIPPSLENSDLQYLHQNYFRHCMESERYLGQLRRALDGNGEMSFNPEQFEGATKTSGTLTAAIESPEDSGRESASASSSSVSSGVISHTHGGHSGMYLNPHSSSNSHYFGGIENMLRRFLTPGGYDGMLVNPTDLTNSQYFGGSERIPGSSPTPTVGWGKMIPDLPFLTNAESFESTLETLRKLARSKLQNREDSDQFRPPKRSVTSCSESLGETADMSPSPGSYDPTPIIDQGGSDSGQIPSASASSSSVCVRGSEEFPSLDGDGKMLSYPNDLTNTKPLGGAAETIGRFTYEIYLPKAKRKRRNYKDSDQVRPPEGLESSFSGSPGRTADMSFSAGNYDGLLSHPLDSTNPTPIRDQGGSDSGQFPSSSASSSFVRVRGSEEFPSLGGDDMLSKRLNE